MNKLLELLAPKLIVNVLFLQINLQNKTQKTKQLFIYTLKNKSNLRINQINTKLETNKKLKNNNLHIKHWINITVIFFDWVLSTLNHPFLTLLLVPQGVCPPLSPPYWLTLTNGQCWVESPVHARENRLY